MDHIFSPCMLVEQKMLITKGNKVFAALMDHRKCDNELNVNMRLFGVWLGWEVIERGERFL